MNRVEARKALRTWRTLDAVITSTTEADCQRLLEEERSNGARRAFLKRIGSRLLKLRGERERKELGL